jgi:hypothetical protein
MNDEMLANRSTVVQRMRIRATGGDPYAVESRVRNLVSAADLTPKAMPPQAILIVRRFGHGLPALSLSPNRVLPPSEWQEAVSDGLSVMARRAARPIRGPVQDDAEAVWFNDRAELLACLAQDWLSGVQGSRWWWQALFPNADMRMRVPDTWSQSPEYLPAAFQHLAERHVAVGFARKLSGQQVSRLLLQVMRVFSLRTLEAAIATQDRDSAWLQPRTAPPVAHGRTTPQLPIGLRLTAAPWSLWVPEAEDFSHGEPERLLLIVVCLMLARAPEMLRKASFASRVATWMATLASQSAQPAAVPTVRPKEVEPLALPIQQSAPPRETAPPAAPVPRQDAGATTELPVQSPPISHRVTEPVSRNGGVVAEPARLAEQCEIPAGVASGDLIEEPQATSEFAATFDVITGQMTTPVTAKVRSIPCEVRTEFGGALYLINVGVFLGFYGDFTTPLEPGIELPIWDFIACMARELAGREVEADPLWQLLAQLANRSPEEDPGAGHHEWLREQTPRIRTRLMQALGLNDDRELAGLLLHREALVQVTPTHLEAFFSLQDHPIEIRWSGLDRDPGWVPAAGRYVAFHFE